MAPAMATGRLRKELVKLQKDPPPGVIAEPDERNILKWHYAVQGPIGTGFEGGVYIGKLIFPNEYPMKPPGIMMLTPSGRFKVNTRLCMSMSDFHPESWNPMWSVATIIQGVQSFMASEELTTGGLKSPVSEHRRLAAASAAFNEKMFPNLFDGDIDKAFQLAEEARKASSTKLANSTASKATKVTKANKISETVTPPPPVRNRRGKRDKQPKEMNLAKLSLDNTISKSDEEEAASSSIQIKEKELTQEEIEKRRKRNAKKREKQKAKKNLTSQTSTE